MLSSKATLGQAIFRCLRKALLSKSLKLFMEAKMSDSSSSLGSNIKRARKAAGLTQKQLAELVGVTRPAVGQWEADATSPSYPLLAKVADTLMVSVAELLSGDAEGPHDFEPAGYVSRDVQPAPPMVRQVPLISWVQAGVWQEIAVDTLDPTETELYPCPPGCGPNTFALRVRGESMIDRYKPGNIIFVDPDVEEMSGDDIIAICENHGMAEATFKQYLVEPGQERPMLKARNSAWRDPYMEFTSDCRVIGVVMAQMEIIRR